MSRPRPLAQLLEKQLRHRYRALNRALGEGVGPAEAEFQLGGRPTIAWHARHIGDAIESTRQAVFGDPATRAARELGTPTAQDLPAPIPWPTPWESLREAVLDAASGLASRISGATDEELCKPPQVAILPAFRSSLPTRQSFLEGHIYHVTYHVGSIAVLRAEIGLD